MLLEQVLRQSAEPIFVSDKAGRLVLVNDPGRRLFGGDIEGIALADVTGRWADLYEHGRRLAATEAPLHRALRGETHIGRELQLVRRDGVVRTVLVNAAPVWERGEIVAAIANFSEITSYRKSEERYRALVEAIPIGVLRSSIAGDILDANDAFLDMVGYSRDDLEAGRIGWLQMGRRSSCPLTRPPLPRRGKTVAAPPAKKPTSARTGPSCRS